MAYMLICIRSQRLINISVDCKVINEIGYLQIIPTTFAIIVFYICKNTRPLDKEGVSSFPSGRELVGGGLEEGSLDRPVERAAAEHPVLEGVECLDDALRLVQVGAHLAGGEGVA